MKLDGMDAFNRLTEGKEIARFMTIFSGNVGNILNSGISFADNFKGQLLTCVFPSANTDTVFAHQLNAVPTGYLSLGQDAALIVYDGTNVFQRDVVTLRASAAGTARVFIY